MRIMQGDSCLVCLDLKQDSKILTSDLLVELEVSVGNCLRKYYSKSEVTFGEEDGLWSFRLTQTETMQLPPRKYSVVVRVKYLDTPDSDVIGVYIGNIEIVAAPSREVL